MVSRREFLVRAGAGVALASTTTLGATPAVAAATGTGRGRGNRSGRILIAGGQLLTMDPQVPDGPGDVLVEDGRIAQVGSRVNARNATVIKARNMIVAPGMIDNHRHLWGTLLRGFSRDQTFTHYLGQVLSAVAPRLTPRDIYLGGMLGALEALHSGVTTILDWNHGVHTREHALAAVQALGESGARAVFAYGSLATVSDPDGPPSVDDVDAVRAVIDADDLLGLAIAPWSPRSASTPELLARVEADVDLARSLGVVATMHTSFDSSEDLRVLIDRGLLGPHMNLIHANQFTVDDFRAIADAGAWVSSSPEIEQQMGFGPAPLRAMLDGGVRPTVSIDVPSGIAGDLFSQLKTLLQTQRMLDHRAAAADGGALSEILPVADMLPYATTNAAASLGMGDEIGSLTVGKQADIILIDRTDPNLALSLDPAASLVLYAHPGAVDTVLVGGRIVKRQGKLVDLPVDLAAIRREAQAAQRRLLDA